MAPSQSSRPVVCKLSRLAISELIRIDRDSTSPPWSERLFEQEFKNRYATVYGVRHSGKLVGYLVAHHVLGDGHILNFVVESDFRRNGIGSYLLTEVIRDLFRRGVSKIWLEVRVSNEPALGLYSHFGFHRIGLRKRYYSDNQEDAFVLELSTQEYFARLRKEPVVGIEHQYNSESSRIDSSLL